MPEPRRDTFFTRQPGKGIWSILSLVFNAARLPFWFLYFTPRSFRQDPRWTWKKAVRMRLVRVFLSWASDVEMVVPWNLTPGAEQDQWVTLRAADPKYFTGVTVVDPEIKPAKIGGTWYPSLPGVSQKATKVVLHFHGGAFVIGDGRKEDAGFLAKTLLKNAGVSHVFSCQYRLASNPGGRFPAALQDAITAYTYLVFEQNIDPADIIVSGDSAGGNLTLCLLRYISDHGRAVNLPSPKCGWLWSPWVNPGSSVTSRSSFHLSPNAPKDYLNKDFGAWGANCYRPAKSTGLTNDCDYINFLDNPFPTETPLFFSVCENEVLLFDGRKTYEAFSAIEGNKTELSIEPAAPHDIMLMGKMVGFEEEAAQAAKAAGQYLVSL